MVPHRPAGRRTARAASVAPAGGSRRGPVGRSPSVSPLRSCRADRADRGMVGPRVRGTSAEVPSSAQHGRTSGGSRARDLNALGAARVPGLVIPAPTRDTDTDTDTVVTVTSQRCADWLTDAVGGRIPLGVRAYSMDLRER